MINLQKTQTKNDRADNEKSLTFEFKGNGFEYFKVWIVNVLLTIVTFGIYSAWATVRNNNYFYSNLYLDGTNFRYLATPFTILKGRLIAMAVLLVYMLVSSVFPLLTVVFVLGLLIAAPYLCNQSLAFKHRVSAYKNIQFRFKATYFEAFMVLYVWPILGLLTLGLLYPLALLKLNRYLVNNSAYGTTRFEFKATFKDYGLIFLMVLGIGGGMLILVTVVGLLGILVPPLVSLLSVLQFVLIPAAYIGVGAYFVVATTRVFYANAVLEDHGFSSTITIGGWIVVVLKNFILTVITLGLYAPAAKVRMVKYLSEQTHVHVVGSLDQFVAAEKVEVGALADEIGEAFDLGLVG